MYYYEFEDDNGIHRISSKDAQAFLNVSKRTIENYRYPEKRDPVKWAYLEAYATGRIIPDHWEIRLRDDVMTCSTGWRLKKWELEQVAHAHSLKDNTINGLTRDIDALRAELETLQAEYDLLLESTRPAPLPDNVVQFPTGKRP